MIFQNRQGTNLNRKRLRIVSQTAEEIIADVERADNPTVEGTPIDASTMNQLQSEIDTANSNASSAVSTANSAASTANTASQNASAAVTTANAAASDAASAVTTANAANTKALYVESQLADRGATIKFNGVSQAEVNFTSDPQTQINNRIQYSELLNLVYPVGSIYISTSSTNPGTLFGGTWQAFAQGRTLIGVGTSDQAFSAGATGGESTHTLTTNEMPSHTHIQDAHGHTGNNKSFSFWWRQFTHSNNSTDAAFSSTGVWRNADNTNVTLSQVSSNNNTNAIGQGSAWGYRQTKAEWSHTPSIQNTTATNQNAGGGLAHNNLQPYIVTYIWQRTA